jgi:hypothetical protein
MHNSEEINGGTKEVAKPLLVDALVWAFTDL